MEKFFEPNVIRITHLKVADFCISYSGSVQYQDAFGFKTSDTFMLIHHPDSGYLCTFYCFDGHSYQKKFDSFDSFTMYCFSLG